MLNLKPFISFKKLLNSVQIRICIAVMLTMPAQTFSQNQTVVDSLTNYLEYHAQKDSLHVDALNQLAFEYYLDNPKKLELAHRARELAKEIHYQKGEAEAWRQIGLFSWGQGNFSDALTNLFTGLKIAETVNDLQTIANINASIGLVYQVLGDYPKAISFHETSLNLQRKLNNKFRETEVLNNLGYVKRALRDYPAAIEYYNKALKLCEETINLNGKATSMRNLGIIYEEKEMFDVALSHYLRSMKIFDLQNEKRGMTQCRFAIASFHLKRGNYNQGKQYALEGLDISLKANFRAFIRDGYLLLSQLSEAQGMVDQSFEYFKRHSAYQDSVLNVQVGSAIAMQHFEYESQKKQAEIDLLKKDRQIKESIITEKNTFLVSSAVTLLFVIAMGVILFKNYSLQKSANRSLSIKNKEIEHQRNELAQQRDQLVALNAQLIIQQETVKVSRDVLAKKNASIAEMNDRMLTIKLHLEKLVADRTLALEKQNQQLIEYNSITAHGLKAPLGKILATTNLLNFTLQSEEQERLVVLLRDSAVELDEVTKAVSQIIGKRLIDKASPV